jgi:hypothetical protein
LAGVAVTAATVVVMSTPAVERALHVCLILVTAAVVNVSEGATNAVAEATTKRTFSALI